MAPFTMATLPLQSCRMGFSLEVGGDGSVDGSRNFISSRWLQRRRETIHGDRAGFGAAIEADAASGAVFAGVMRRMHAVGVELGPQLQTFGRTGFNTQSAAFAFFFVDEDVASC